MAFFSDIDAAVDALRALLGDEVEAGDLPAIAMELGNEAAVAAIAHATTIKKALDSVTTVASGVIAMRSTRDAGHGGLAQTRGHRTPVSLVQELTGATRRDAEKQVRVGGSLIESRMPETPPLDSPAALEGVVVAERAWHASVDDALLSGRITAAQHDAIVRGLGAVPTPEGADDLDDSAWATAVAAVAEAWACAAAQLVDEAGLRTVEELGQSARTIRDMLDAAGAARRFDERFQRRKFRMWTDEDGMRRGSINFDDEGAVWWDTVIASALRPRRGGPRFVDAEQKTRAEELVDDPRTNDQLAYDLVMDIFRAGALADSEQVFGTRQAGIRLIVTADAANKARNGEGVDGGDAIAITEDHGIALPAWVADQHLCDTGYVEATLDHNGNPLYLGREQRLFSAKQKLALALRDGGCRWRGCDRPASYCEAHHIDHYVEDEGCTDIDRGILLCRFHHMNLHHGGWRITRHGLDDFLLHPPGGGEPIALPPRLHLTYLWDTPPPQRRFRLAA